MVFCLPENRKLCLFRQVFRPLTLLSPQKLILGFLLRAIESIFAGSGQELYEWNFSGPETFNSLSLQRKSGVNWEKRRVPTFEVDERMRVEPRVYPGKRVRGRKEILFLPSLLISALLLSYLNWIFDHFIILESYYICNGAIIDEIGNFPLNGLSSVDCPLESHL